MTLEQLLALEDEEFITSAYLAVLDRTPDPEGLENHLLFLRSGKNKLDLLVSLRNSPEGMEKSRDIPGLDDALECRHRRAPAWLRKFLRRWRGKAVARKSQSEQLENHSLMTQDFYHQLKLAIENHGKS